MAFSPDGRTLASGSSDRTARLWDAITGNHKTTFTAHTDTITSVAFSPDGRTLASGSRDETIRLWDAITGHRKTTLTGHTSYVTSVAFSPDGRTLASGGSWDETVRLWDARSGQHQRTLSEHAERVHKVAFSPDGKTLAIGTTYNANPGELWLWDVATGKYQPVKSGFLNSVNFAFSPDGQTFATQTKMGQQVMLWDAITGVVKKTFPWHSSYFRNFAFSPDGRTLATGTRDGFVFLWEITPDILQPSRNISAILPRLPAYPPQIRVIHFLPSDQTLQPNIATEIQTLAKETQDFCAQQMENHGFGRKTFQLETDSNGKTVVYHLQGSSPAEDYISQRVSITRELEDLLDLIDHIYLVVLDPSLQGALGGFCGLALTDGRGVSGGAFQMSDNGRLAIVYASGYCAGVDTTAHELGHTFGLPHDYRDNDYVMNHGPETPRFSYAAAEWLNVHPFLNRGQPDSENPTKIEVLSPRASQLQFQITDTDGLQQAQLVLNNVTNKTCGGTDSLHHFQTLNGTSSITLKFASTKISTEAQLRVIDRQGSISWKNLWIEPDSSVQTVQADVNDDGQITILDLLLVMANYQSTEVLNPRADVNADGTVDKQDILIVAKHLGDSTEAAAPGSFTMPADLTAKTLQEALNILRAHNDGSLAFQRGITYLERLLASVIPEKTALLSNYPNPFNPETWIPYHLSEPAEVALRIYAVDGSLVRTVLLGHQAVGIYQSHSRAAYWDGKNEIGEPVASGVYFYTLTAGDFTATRKMLIRK